ncbi:hypothetical protein TSUD_388730 [Trifolium subterraneum]|uniref:Uncharacterized protein n=1 Tax=Trifolium subterraneum TaxID=3900 RepID=A0A2Z6MKS4_TRISU|nr:hypothetical protein TSUD_388730 [Trifolium subterraneum]
MTRRSSFSSIHTFQVFCFNEEDANQVVKNLHKMNKKFINPNKARSPISKYVFLQAFVSSLKPESKFVHIDPIDLDDDDDLGM